MIVYPIKKNDELSGIYIIRNIINGKIYIGQSKNLAKRRDTHISLSKYIKKDSQPIHKAIAKYGQENFVFYPIIAEKNLSKAQLDYWEKDLINEFKKDGFKLYNVAEGGKGGDLGKKVRQKISQKLKGRKFTLEWREKISKALKGRKRQQEQIEKAKLTFKYKLKKGMYKNKGPNKQIKIITHPEKSHTAWNKGLKGEEYKKHFKKYRVNCILNNDSKGIEI